MNKAVKDALAKGKVLRAELDQKAAAEAKKQEDEKKAKEVAKQARLESEAEYCMNRLPEALAAAVAERKPSFSLMSRDSDDNADFSRLCALIEPKLKKMGLQFKHTSSEHYVYTSFDPDTGYDAVSYHLEVIVPEEGL